MSNAFERSVIYQRRLILVIIGIGELTSGSHGTEETRGKKMRYAVSGFGGWALIRIWCEEGRSSTRSMKENVRLPMAKTRFSHSK